MTKQHWANQADNWLAWARTPGFDAYWKYSQAFFELVPAPRGRTLEVGCGEGRVSRDLASRGHSVTAIDSTARLLQKARDSDASNTYLIGDAAALPFAEASFDLVVFYNSLMDVDDMEGSVLEAVRVLRKGGKVCACVTHPISDAGAFESRAPDAPFVIRGSYLGPRRWLDIPTEKRGLHMDFSGWAYSLEHYFAAMEKAGLQVEALREPAYDETADAVEPSDERWRRVPNFLMWRATRP